MQSRDAIIAQAGPWFDALAIASAAYPGVTRDAYGAGEQLAHDLARGWAEQLGAVVSTDAAGNLYMRLAGAEPGLAPIVLGSHLDSVPHGGNFDGAAGVLAGLAVMGAVRRSGMPLRRDIVVMATRAEEAVWFPVSYPGARAALGVLPSAELEARRVDTGRTLAEHLVAASFDPQTVRDGRVSSQLASIKAFVELHIEQGPRLVARDLPVAVVTAINGGFRFPQAVCFGQYAHSGAEPRFSRADSVLGFAALVTALDQLWDGLEAEKLDLTITFGRVQSDPSQHGGSRVLGEVGFSLDVRSEHQSTLDRVERALTQLCAEIEKRLGVRFTLGERFDWPAVRMNEKVVAALRASATACGLEGAVVPSGAGHDAAVFAEAGIPTAMLFVRSSNGSHNPDEHMALTDFAEGVAVLLAYIRGEDSAPD